MNQSISPKKNIITWIFVFFLVFLLFQLFPFFSKKEAPKELTSTPLGMSTNKKTYAQDEEVIVNLNNNTQQVITIPNRCPKNPLTVLAYQNNQFQEKSAATEVNCQLISDVPINPNEQKSIRFTYWNHSLFGDIGRYKIATTVTINNEQKTFETPEFTVEEKGFFRQLGSTLFYQPIYNLLVLLTSIAPARDLGFAIILLTIIIRLVLLIPSQRAIQSQQRMQALQPKLEKLRKKYEGNQEEIGRQTMALWKEHKVNPFGSCLPTLIQFPILIALFYVIRDGLNPDNAYLLYEPLRSVNLANMHTNFLGMLDLTQPNTIILPLMIGALQFLQMKLMTLKKKKDEDDKHEKKPGDEMAMVSKTMTYVLPVMVALFTASFPSGVGLYWGVSTLFGIGQQIIANRKFVALHPELK